ncbi:MULTISPECIES: SIMPL domain-containing protein [Vitreoscilla]|uniref:SIMPL domain-containing protein n=1 Tax=Vitreoscilla stercoraria TaxID=61 RepID=A0ABY4EFJ1_VITST|nr:MULTISPECIES: SIMPL domain-containing protein [Vitreoscilla]AUZ03920.1 hypothetical protein ADP71_00610 [Vitreoscilla sp. C1]UOO92157.1 SIMPL domain-containing protein [Vitreoscilla stercoraria]
MFYKCMGLTLSLLCANHVLAADVHYNMVNLQDAAQVQVSQNQLTVVLAIESKADQRDAASRDNTLKLNRVLQAIQAQGVKGELLNRSVNQQYEYTNQSHQARGWMDVAKVQIYSEDSAKINQLVAAVQKEARLESQQYGLTTALKRQYVLQATEEAVANFQQQAQQVTQNLGGKRYRIVELNIGEAGQYEMQPRMMMAKGAMAADAAPVAMDMPGETSIRVQVSGKIQIH